MTSTYSPWAWSSPSPKSKPLDEKVLTTPTDSRLSSHTQDLDQFPPFASAHDAIPRRVSSALSEKGLAVSRDGIVSWQTDSKTHPRNWPLIRKIYDSMLICTLEFVMTLISNTGSAVAKSAKDDLHVTEELAILSLVTTYLVGQAVGGLLFPPIAENFGGEFAQLSLHTSCRRDSSRPRCHMELASIEHILINLQQVAPSTSAQLYFLPFSVSSWHSRRTCLPSLSAAPLQAFCPLFLQSLLRAALKTCGTSKLGSSWCTRGS